MFEEVIEGLTAPKNKEQHGKKRFKVEEFFGILDGKITEEMLDNDPRLARIMGR